MPSILGAHRGTPAAAARAAQAPARLRQRALGGDQTARPYDQGELLAQGEAGVEQYVIPSGQIAPYRLIVNTEWAAYGAAQVVLKSADPVDGQSNRFMMLEMQDESGWMENGVFRVMANLRNPETGSARLMRAILTLQNGQGQISGYRIVPLSGSLASGESRLIQFSIPSQPDMAAFQLFVEAIRE